MSKYPCELLHERETLKMAGIGRTTLRELIKKGQAPQPIFMSPKCRRFVAREVEAWIQARIEASRGGRRTPFQEEEEEEEDCEYEMAA